MTNTEARAVADAIKYSLVSPNEGDSNGEPANMVDAIFAHARMTRTGLNNVADALRELAAALANSRRDEPNDLPF